MDGRFAQEGVALVSTAAKIVCRTETSRPHVCGCGMDGRFAQEGVALVSTAAKIVCRTETSRPHVCTVIIFSGRCDIHCDVCIILQWWMTR